MPTLDRITVFPVKSLDGLELERAEVLAGGGLAHDRRWQFVDLEGCVVHAKRLAILHAIRAEFEIPGVVRADRWEEPPAENTISLAVDPAALAARAVPGIERLAVLRPETFPLVAGTAGPCGWLAEAVGFDVRLLERADGGFPDDREAAGPTLISTATLVEIARWFGFSLEECRRRFRANFELGGCDAFWEDTLAIPARPELALPLADLAADLPADPYAALPPPEPREFLIGSVGFRATNVCRRCVVPSRDSRTGAVTEHFRDAFEARRLRVLRADVDAAAWNHVYRAAVNTRPCVAGGSIFVGDHVGVT
ncbi:MAG: hypothetical protein RLZZ440_2984 [Planctomycetota bacterium]